MENSIHPLLRRAFIYLEDSDWIAADEYCEKMLDQDPENAEAYLGKLMADLQCSHRKELREQSEPFFDNSNYAKIIRFGSEELKEELNGYLDYITKRNEQSRLEEMYTSALEQMDIAKTERDYERIIEALESIPGYKDTDNQLAICRVRISEIQAENEEKRLVREVQAKRFKKAAMIVTPIACLIAVIVVILVNVIIPGNKYKKAIELHNNGQFQEAIAVFTELGDYKDAADQLLAVKYDEAQKFLTDKDYSNAIAAFGKLESYRDAAEQVYVAKYADAQAACENGKWDYAAIRYHELGDYEDSVKLLSYCLEQKIKTCKVGDYIVFGKFEQDTYKLNSGEEIEWLVLKRENDQALIISRYIIDTDVFAPHNSTNQCSWSYSRIRSSLNKSFLEKAFSDKERTRILEIEGEDKVFLLSTAQAQELFSSNSARRTMPTVYAKTKGEKLVAESNNSSYYNTNWWWLRSKSPFDSDCVVYVQESGQIDMNGIPAHDDINIFAVGGIKSERSIGGVRPAMWIDLS